MKQVESDFELPRLSEGGDPALSRAVSGLRAHQPDITELASLASQLAVRGIPVTSPEAPPSAASAAWKKWALAGGSAASGLVLWWALREPTPEPSDVPRESPAEFAPRAVGMAEPSAVAPRSGGPAPTIASAAPVAPLPDLTASETPTPTQSASPVEALAPSAPRSTSTDTEADTARVAPTPRAPSSVATSRPVVPEDASAVSAPTEIELLRDARLALKSSPARALALVESHARSYPNGKLTQERELIAITALVALGRRTAALSRASQFEQTFPQSPYRKQIGDLLQ